MLKFPLLEKFFFSFFLWQARTGIIMAEPRHETTCLMPYANNKGADHDQPAHPRSLISAFIVRFLDG